MKRFEGRENVLLNDRMFLMHMDACDLDVAEVALLNNVFAAVNAEGNRLFCTSNRWKQTASIRSIMARLDEPRGLVRLADHPTWLACCRRFPA